VWAPRRIALGGFDDRRFVFSCGVGIDATVVRRVDAHPRLKARAGPYYYTWAAISSFYRNYLRNPVRLRVETDSGGPAEGVTALAQNSDPFTYFASRPIRVCDGVAIDDGSMAVGVLERAAQRDMPGLVPRLFSETRPAARHRRIEHFAGVTEASIASTSNGADDSPRSFPVQVDGDYIGEATRLELRAEPGVLTVVA
jgi:diacylglycerol kinase family enzyme